MTTTITSLSLINAISPNDYLAADQTSNSAITARLTPEQLRGYNGVGFSATVPTFRRKLSGVKTGANNCRILALGDSTVLGTGSSATALQRVYWNWASTLQRYINKAGVTCQRDTTLADGDGTNSTFDSRITKGSSWATPGDNTCGGVSLLSSTNTNAYSFTPTGIVDTFIVYYQTRGFAGTFSADIDGGTPVTQSTTGADGLATKTVTVTYPGIHTINLTWSSGGGVLITGIEAYNSTIKQVQIMTAGWGGATTVNMAASSTAYGALNGLKKIAPDLTLLMPGINDWINATNLTTFTTSYQALITAAQVSGDCIIITPYPSNPATYAKATQDSYVDIIRSLAATNNIPVIDIYALMQPYANLTGLYSDNVHPNGLGYEIVAKCVFNFLNIAGAGSYTLMPGFPFLIQTVTNTTYNLIPSIGCSGTILGLGQKAGSLTTAGAISVAIGGADITGLTGIVPSTAGSYTAATGANTFTRGQAITLTTSGTTLVADLGLVLDYAQTL